MDALSPIRRQYLDVKRRYPHAIVFFRLGDFYETFDDDAELCSRELDITLTSKPMGKGLRVPLAGIPYHAVDGYIAKLIAKGYKVALCEQMSDPATSKGIVDRQVVRVVTPGTVIEGNLLDERANNYLACLAPSRRARSASADPWPGDVGFAYIDISTGEFVAGALTQEQAAEELARIRPAEVLIPDGAAPPPWLDAATHVTSVEPLWFDHDLATVTVQEHFRVERFGQKCEHAAGGCIDSVWNGAVRGEDDDRQHRMIRLDTFKQRQAVHCRHAQVRHHDVRQECRNALERRAAAVGGHRFVTGPAQPDCEYLQQIRIIVDDQDASFAASFVGHVGNGVSGTWSVSSSCCLSESKVAGSPVAPIGSVTRRCAPFAHGSASMCPPCVPT